MVKNLPAMRKTWVQSLSWKDPLEENIAALQYSCLENPRGLAGYSPWGHKESDTTERLSMHTRTHSSILAWKIPQRSLVVCDLKESVTTE